MKEKFAVVERVELIKEVCAGKKVLHLGCTNYPYTKDSIDKNMLLHFEIAKVAKKLYGFDFDQAGIDALAEAGIERLFQADLENLAQVPITETFEVIIAGEMIEHLSNPGLFLCGIKRFMNTETKLLITTINAYCGMRNIIYALRGKGGKNEPVHPDHVAYYSFATLKLVVEREGLALQNFSFYDIGKEHRPYNPWYWNLVNDICVKLAPQLADGVIAECRLK